MPVADLVADLQQSLAILVERLGLDQDTLRESEGAGGAAAVRTVPVDQLEPISQAQLDVWLEAFGEALTIRCRQDDQGKLQGKPWTATQADHDRANLKPLLDEARHLQREVQVSLNLDKQILAGRIRAMLLEQHAMRLNETRIALFFFAAKLETILRDSHSHGFETALLLEEGAPDMDRLLLVLVADAPGRLQGPFLAILGNDHLDAAPEFLAVAEPLNRVRAAREVAAEAVWDERPQLLTPDFLELRGVPDAADGLAVHRGELVRLQNELVVPHLANRTLQRDGSQVSIFEGARSVEVAMEPQRTSTNLYSLYSWAYQETPRTRLEIVRRVVAARLQAGPHSFVALVNAAPEVLSESMVQLRLLVDKNIGESFERREKIETLVRDYADEVSRQITSLSREVVDNIYKTVGLLVGVGIGYLLKPSEGGTLLVVGGTLYVSYLLFIVRFYLRSLKQEQKARRLDFARRKQEVRALQVLTAESVNRLNSVAREDAKLKGKLDTVFRIYWFIIILAILLMAGGLTCGVVRKAPQAVRARALTLQLLRFEKLGYEDVRAQLPGSIFPVPLTDAAGRVLFPDLSAVRKDGSLLVMAYVPCSRIGKPQELGRLFQLFQLARQRHAELQILTEPICGEEPGPHRLRDWLQHWPDLRIWTP